MRKLCLSGFRLVALFCSLVAPPFAVYDSLNQDEQQQVATFIANLAVFQQRVSAMPKAPQRLRGKYIEFEATSHCTPFKKCQNEKINFHRRTRRHRRGQRRNDSRTCSIEIFDKVNEQAVDILLQLKRIAIGCRIYFCGLGVR